MKIKPLSLEQYFISLAIGASSIIWGCFIKFLPLRWFENLKINEEPLTDEEEENSVLTVLRKSHRQSLRNNTHTMKFNIENQDRKNRISKNNDLLNAASCISYQQVI